MTFEKIGLRYKYLINKKEIDGNVRRACVLLNRICDAIAVIKEFALTITLSTDVDMEQECIKMIDNLLDKRDKLEDTLEDIKVYIKFD